MRVPLPAHIHLDGHIYVMSDWSVRGATVQLGESAFGESARSKPFAPGQSFDAFVIFKMDSFALHIPMRVSVRHVNAAKKKMGIMFQDMSPRQLSVMQQMVSAYISGELTTVDDIIHVVERNNFVHQRSMPPAPLTLSRRIERLVRKILVFTAALLIFGYLALSIYERNFIIEADNAYVDAGSFTVNTPAGGTVFYTTTDQGTAVKEGSPLAVVQSRTGTVTTIESPCNCVINQTLVPHGNLVNERDSIMTLMPKGAQMYVTAYMPYEHTRRIRQGQEAHIALSGTSIRLPGTVDHISHVPAIKNGLYQLRIVLREPVDSSLLGTPAHVTIDTLR